MSLADLAAAAGFVGAAIALVTSSSPRGLTWGVLGVGAGMGAVGALATGLGGFAIPFGCALAASTLLWLGGLDLGLRPSVWLLGPTRTVGKTKVFGQRSLRLLIGVGGLVAARLLSGHLHAGTIATQGPAFACLFAWEVGVIRIGTSQGAADLGLGVACSGMGATAFILLSSPAALPGAAIAASLVPALFLGLVGRAAPWEATT